MDGLYYQRHREDERHWDRSRFERVEAAVAECGLLLEANEVPCWSAQERRFLLIHTCNTVEDLLFRSMVFRGGLADSNRVTELITLNWSVFAQVAEKSEYFDQNKLSLHWEYLERPTVVTNRQDFESNSRMFARLLQEGCELLIFSFESQGEDALFRFTYEYVSALSARREANFRHTHPRSTFYFTICTSGSTGCPKIIRNTLESVTAGAMGMGRMIDSFDALILVNPLHHINSSILWFWVLLSRANANRQEGPYKVALYRSYTRDFWSGLVRLASDPLKDNRMVVPIVCKLVHFAKAMSVENENSNHSPLFQNVARLISNQNITLLIGSSPFSCADLQVYLDVFGATEMPLIRYGASETALHCISVPRLDPKLFFALMCSEEQFLSSCGMRGNLIGLVDGGDRSVLLCRFDDTATVSYTEVEQGEIGEILVTGDNVPEQLRTVVVREGESKYYAGLGDKGFFRVLNIKGELKKAIYFVSRSADIYIRGGANYLTSDIFNLWAERMKECSFVSGVDVVVNSDRSILGDLELILAIRLKGGCAHYPPLQSPVCENAIFEVFDTEHLKKLPILSSGHPLPKWAVPHTIVFVIDAAVPPARTAKDSLSSLYREAILNFCKINRST